MSRRNLLILLLSVVVSYACYLRGEQNPFARYAAEGLDTIKQGSLDAVPSRELFDGAMRGMVGVLHKHGDEHSQYLNEAEANPLRSQIHQQFGGIGVRIGFLGEQHRLAIVAPPDQGTPAARAKLQPGDFILAINDQPTDGIKMSDVLRLVRGEPGSLLRLKIESPSEPAPRTVELVREVINTESVLGDRRDKDGSWQFRLESDPRIALDSHHVVRRSHGGRVCQRDVETDSRWRARRSCSTCATIQAARSTQPLPFAKCCCQRIRRLWKRADADRLLLHRYA